MTQDDRNNALQHAQYLAYQLAPDLRDMHMIETAKDVREAAKIIERLDNHCKALEHKLREKG